MKPVPMLIERVIIPPSFDVLDCINCENGLIDPPPLLCDRPLWQERMTQWRAGQLKFCKCPAGRRYAAWCSGASERAAADERQERELPAKLAAQRTERIFQSAGIPDRYAAFTIAGFERIAANDPGKREAIMAIRHYDQYGHAAVGSEQRPGIMLWGKPGTGKTGSLSPLFVSLVKRGNSGLWLQYNQLMAEMKRFEDGQVDERMRMCQTVDYLFLDDLGDPAATKVATDYARDVMFRIVDYRTSRNMPIFVTTNLSPQELSDQFHDRTARRLLSACAVINMQGKTLR